jgi:hypothetical protein
MSGLDRDRFPFLRPNRLSVTVPHSLYRSLERRAVLEGRSLSNLAAYLLESALGEASSTTRESDHGAIG